MEQSDAGIVDDPEGAKLKRLIVESITAKGFRLNGRGIVPPDHLDKHAIRGLQSPAVSHRVARSREGLIRREPTLLRHFAHGSEVEPSRIRPRLVEIAPDTEEELLFRYASLHWSVPVSSGYGRRIRFLVRDEHNGKLIGIFGLGDPVFNLKARDAWIGWSAPARRENLYHVMDAYVLGAVPPYSRLLCGKLVAMLAASDEVRQAFRRKYRGKRSLIRGRSLDGRLAMVTTMSALGKSSIYNRLSYSGRLLYRTAGYSKGSGEFHFSDGLYPAISEYAARNCEPSEKKAAFGDGFRSKREVIRKALASLGLSREWVYHGINREVFVVPLASNTAEFLRGEHLRLRCYRQNVQDLFEYFRERWLLPRAERDSSYKEFDPSTYAIWSGIPEPT